MPTKKPTARAHSYAPENCIHIVVNIPIGEIQDAINDGEAGVEELASAHAEILKSEIRRTVQKHKGRTG